MTTSNRSAAPRTADPLFAARLFRSRQPRASGGPSSRSHHRSLRPAPCKGRGCAIPRVGSLAGRVSRCLGVRVSGRVGILVCALLLPASAGCMQFASAWANISGGDVVEPEFTLTKGPLLLLIDDPNNVVTEPRAVREVFATISDIFLEFKVNRQIIPWEEREQLERSEKGYHKLSIRQIGEKLGAEQVLYIQIERFSLQGEEGAPLLKGEFVTRIKVLSTKQDHEVRLWPREPSGKRISATTPPVSSEGDKTASDVAKELAIKMGQAIAELFYEHRSLDKIR